MQKYKEGAKQMTDLKQSETKQFNPDIVLYHAECQDGFAAAWTIWRKYPNATFIPVKYGDKPPAGLRGKRIVIVDFSYAADIIDEIAKSAEQLQILDHHVTARQALAGRPYAHFDITKSGAVLAWEWAHPNEPTPWLPQYVQDRDLWQWNLPLSREINAALASYPFSFEAWSGFNKERLELEGKAILRFQKSLIDSILEEVTFVQFEGETVPSVHSRILRSELGERLSQEHPFCIIWHQQNGRCYFSLRSKPGAANVANIAARYGGGGHANAAGFSINMETSANTLNPISALNQRQIIE